MITASEINVLALNVSLPVPSPSIDDDVVQVFHGGPERNCLFAEISCCIIDTVASQEDLRIV